MAAILALSLRRLGRIEVVTLVPAVEAKAEDGREPILEFYYLVRKFHCTFFFKNKSRFQTNVGRLACIFFTWCLLHSLRCDRLSGVLIVVSGQLQTFFVLYLAD